MMDKRSNVSSISSQETVATRIFDAPRDTVFKAWAEQKHLEKWWGPKGFKVHVNKLDFRPEGVFHYRMQSPDGHEMWGKFIYREIVAPERLAFVISFSDKDGNTVRSAASPDWPLELLLTATFAEHQGRTTLAIQGVPTNATEAEQKGFKAGLEPMQKRFAGTLDQLVSYLART
jgi:uncharacterized protein YndB with AHSA1/START domain